MEFKKYKKVTVDGTIIEVKFMNLKDMQTFVGGYIEIVGQFIVNEDGKMLNLPRNKMFPQFVGNVIIGEY